ncbi:unnamed protein product [Rotaria magnacalcarata]|uniref:Uncharacterized protein n=1 Tax=Rotaria magnacalcarata TaxID=392030 RepID=A0A814YJJ8_9BILA|nr:unnamed protein product [Rotaria magnacalcarata]CAF1231250.1 unnamed protein product [Rotaria magnacalcarata]CAF3975276.1 unnamed protein product [Rotaria magnacalcarata]CAF4461157.1 unnamed protein product [Rotaria magnacalcarata]CAF4490979.1 unnamed protein product [Rotaria magnacalcarata]
MRVRIQTSTLSIVTTTVLNRPDPLRDNGRQLDHDMVAKLFDNDQQVEFQCRMILNENDRKYFLLTYTRHPIPY